VLDEAGVPIDVVAGSSMGAVVGLGYATGAPVSALDATARNRSSLPRLAATVDVAMTGDGFLAGHRLMAYLRPFLQGAVDFDDLVMPARAIASDLAHGEAFAIGAGSLEHAIRASIAMPPVLTPVVWDGRTLVDGGLVDPIPVDAARALGADVVIGVDVVPPLDPNATTVLTRVSRGLNWLNPLAWPASHRRRLNLVDVVMHAFQLVECELGSYKGQTADVMVHPQLGSNTWIDFYRAPKLIAGGVRAAREALPEVTRVLREHPAAVALART
jgi:NTE family protein